MATLEEFPDATIVRPSYVYGNEDEFLNRFGWFLKWSPFGVPVFNNGNTLMRPVYVGDVAQALCNLQSLKGMNGKICELFGYFL